ncbi:intracellular chloride channel [Aureococcus anophagefferens]|nr:intracellular chloride channel [Aureococcus anophagefferens]
MRGSWRTTRRASASCSSRAATSVKPILLLLLLAPPGDADRPVLFQHIPGTGGSSLMTALRRYGCARGLSLCPVVGGVRKHGPEDPRWASVAAYDVVASHLPSVDAADAWRLSHPGGRVLTVLRDPVVYAHKHDPGAAPRLDAQYQYLRHGWRRDAAASRGPRCPRRTRARSCARFDVVGVLGAGTATHPSTRS